MGDMALVYRGMISVLVVGAVVVQTKNAKWMVHHYWYDYIQIGCREILDSGMEESSLVGQVFLC